LFGFGEHFDCGEGHGDADFHIEGAGAPEAAVVNATGHGAKGADGPNGIEVAEQENGPEVLVSTTETRFEDVAVIALAVKLDAAAEISNGLGGDGNALVYS
jgi:hypothetical protein